MEMEKEISMESEGPEAPEAGADESSIIDQIGALLNRLSPEKQKEVIGMLGQMLSGDAQMGVAAEHAGPNGVPMMQQE